MALGDFGTNGSGSIAGGAVRQQQSPTPPMRPTYEARGSDPNNPGNLSTNSYPNDPLVERYKNYQAPTTLDQQTQQQLAAQLGLINAQYQNSVGDYTTMYGINSRQNQNAAAGIGLDNADVQSRIAQQQADDAYRQRMIQSLQGDVASYGSDRQLQGQVLNNQLQGIQQDLRGQNFATNNKYISGGGQFTPGFGFNLGQNFGQAWNKATQANLQNSLTNNTLDRSVSQTNREIFGQENQQNQNAEQIKQLNNQLAKNGLRLKDNSLSMEQLKAEFDSRIKNLGITQALDTNKLFNDLLGQNNASASNVLRTVLPDLVG